MPILPIAKYQKDEKVLRRRAKPIPRITDRHRRLIADMIETMHAAAGVGLAAPQVFIGQRLFVYDMGEGAHAVINPEIVQAEGEELGVEGCLSIPRLQGEVPRYTQILVTGLDEKGRRVRIPAEGYLARVFQHEIDHLNGVLFIDRADRTSLHWITDEEEEERVSRGKRRRVVVSVGGRRAAGTRDEPAAAEEPVGVGEAAGD